MRAGFDRARGFDSTSAAPRLVGFTPGSLPEPPILCRGFPNTSHQPTPSRKKYSSEPLGGSGAGGGNDLQAAPAWRPTGMRVMSMSADPSGGNGIILLEADETLLQLLLSCRMGGGNSCELPRPAWTLWPATLRLGIPSGDPRSAAALGASPKNAANAASILIGAFPFADGLPVATAGCGFASEGGGCLRGALGNWGGAERTTGCDTGCPPKSAGPGVGGRPSSS